MLLHLVGVLFIYKCPMTIFLNLLNTLVKSKDQNTALKNASQLRCYIYELCLVSSLS